MSWIQTYTGRKFTPMAPEPGDIDIRDIAHALAFLCRFNGHCHSFYSVAEHSVRVSCALPAGLAMQGLLHDAAEAYISDIPRPVKEGLPRFRELEDRLLARIMARFGQPEALTPDVLTMDTQLLATEARDLMLPPPEPWNLGADPLPETIEPWEPTEAETRFLQRFRELGGTLVEPMQAGV